MSKFFEQIPSILGAAAENPLSFAALVIIALSTLAYLLLPKNGNPYPRIAALAFLAVGFLGLAFVVILSQSNPSVTIRADNRIIIGAKKFMESNVLLEMMALVIENDHKGVHVERKFYFGETEHTFQALLARKIDVYAEYTGTILAKHLDLEPGEFIKSTAHGREQINELLARDNVANKLEMLDKFGFNNTFVLVMLKERVEELKNLGLWPKHGALNIPALADATRKVKNHAKQKIVFGSIFGFFSRERDGYKGLVGEYSLTFTSSIYIDNHEDKLDLLLKRKIDVTDFYSTDAELDDDRIVRLEERESEADDPFFPRYDAAPLMRKDFRKSHPGFVESLRKLGGIKAEDMSKLLAELKRRKVNASELPKDTQARGPRKKLREVVDEFLDDKDII